MSVDTARTTTSTGTTTASATGLTPAQLVARQRPGYSLEAALYDSREFFDLDMAGIFRRHWLFVAAEAELPEPGDYVTVELGRASVIVLRDDDEQVRAFHNVCRHRGSRLLDDACGSVGNLVCPYHHWTYGVDGRLLHADNQPPTLDRSTLGLRPVHVRAVEGLVFICLADEPPADFDDVMARVQPYLAPYGLTRTKVAHQVDIVEQGNWKLVMENNRECYHCDGHPELLTAYFPLHGYTAQDCPPRLRPVWQRFEEAGAALSASCSRQGFPTQTMRELDDRPTGFMINHSPLDGDGHSYSAGGKSVCRRRLGAIDDPRFGDFHLHLQPNSWFHMLSDNAVVFSVLPLDEHHSRLRTTWLVHEDAVEGVDYDLDALIHVWSATNAQDSAFVARTQLGVLDPAYTPGPYSQVEGDVEAFVTWYTRRMADYLARR
ncbi:aromatic ring-hydroxylating oxygenase subunit alpha [Agilicoccus flavus]|uniref:aromatic ring-hydroxylating oxygenase subunit alpha n=1 Tax=Agilicoccus flavus TaxID=2775968 RepID=UPI001CF640A7|nr:aromatic ring-hydroxylating dioxygenase subunit alpha [Agilicoccus flavus]